MPPSLRTLRSARCTGPSVGTDVKEALQQLAWEECIVLGLGAPTRPKKKKASLSGKPWPSEIDGFVAGRARRRVTDQVARWPGTPRRDGYCRVGVELCQYSTN